MSNRGVGLMLALLLGGAVSRAQAQDMLPFSDRPGEKRPWRPAGHSSTATPRAAQVTARTVSARAMAHPSLRDGGSERGDASYEWLIHMTQQAGWGARDRGDDPRPRCGPSGLDPVHVDQVAAYVWLISRETAPAKPTD
jgi:hypothetical protein